MSGSRPSPLPALAAAVLLSSTTTAVAAAADTTTRLVVRGDDMGSSQASNAASIRCFRDGVMRDVELMAVGPWFPEAARLLRENPGLDVGLHLALTSEWDNVKWRPLTTAPSLVGPNGTFHPMIWPHPHYGKAGALKEQPWKLDEIERELRAQIELTRREVPHLSHLSDHMGFQALGPEVAALVKRLAGEYGLDVDTEALGARWVGWDGKPLTPEEKVPSFLRVLEKLEPGTWIFVDHPALDTPEMRAIGHVGYENVAVDRQGVTDAWTSPAAKEIVRRRGIELVGYRDLVRRNR
ncbi:MAG TPA: ChbG/HpnK family deacetylase [Vicinamibacteria bacterium]